MSKPTTTSKRETASSSSAAASLSFTRTTFDTKSSSSTSGQRLNPFQDDDDDDHPSQTSKSKHHGTEEIVAFDRQGGRKRVASPVPSAPRVIPLASNLDWREDRKKRLGLYDKAQQLGSLVSMQKSGLHNNTGNNSSRNTSTADTSSDRIKDEEQKRGLEIPKSRQDQDAVIFQVGQDDLDEPASLLKSTPPASPPHSPPPQTAEQAAIQALLAGEGVGESSKSTILTNLIIPQPSETESFKIDVDTRPDAPTLDDYASTPVEVFGAALLRGMGWKEGMGAGKNGKGLASAPEPKKRASLLGLGAKERPTQPSILPNANKSFNNGGHRYHKHDRKYVPVSRESLSSSSNTKSESRQPDYNRRDRSLSSTHERRQRKRSPDQRPSLQTESKSSNHHRPRRYDSETRRQTSPGRSTLRESSHGHRDRDRERDRDRDRSKERHRSSRYDRHGDSERRR